MTKVVWATFTGPTSLKRPVEKGLTRNTFTLCDIALFQTMPAAVILNMCADNNTLPEVGRAVNI